MKKDSRGTLIMTMKRMKAKRTYNSTKITVSGGEFFL